MANQPTKYKKFVATAATATLVASAIVPVASAAGFSDVAENNSHAEAINSLVEAGIIKGFEDGTFGPNKELTRGHVVKMLGKWVEAQGFEIPADYATVQRFDDVAVDAKDQELVKYAALVKDSGVFVGSEGKLNAADNITRENMALTLDRAYKAVFGKSLVELAAGSANKTVADLATAKEEAREEIQAIRNLGISNVDAFSPKNTVTRGQFASFLYRTTEAEGAATEVGAIKSLTATKVNELTVEFDGPVADTAAAQFTVARGTSNIAVSDVEWNENKTQAVLTVDTKFVDATYTLTVNGVAKEALTKEVTTKAEEPTSMKFLSNALVLTGATDINTGANEAKIPFEVYNQYGEDITEDVLVGDKFSVDVKGIDDVSAEVTAQGIVTVFVDADEDEGTAGTIELSYEDDAKDIEIEISQDVTLSEESEPAKVEMAGIYNVNNKAFTAKEVEKNQSGYYVLFTAKDQYGVEIDAEDTNLLDNVKDGLRIDVSNDNIFDVKDESEITVLPVDGEYYFAIPLSFELDGSYLKETGENTVTIKSRATGEVATANYTLEDSSKVAKIELGQPSEIVAGNEEVKVPVTVTNQSNEAYTNVAKLNELLGTEILVTGDEGLAVDGFSFEEENGQIFLVFTTGSQEEEEAVELDLDVEVKSFNNESSITLEVQENAYAKTLVKLSNDVVTSVYKGHSVDFDSSDFVIEDQYGREYDKKDGFTITATSLSDNFTVNEDAGSVAGDAGFVISAAAADTDSNFHITSVKDGSATVEFVLTSTNTDVNSKISKTFTTVDEDDFVSYKVDSSAFVNGKTITDTNEVTVYGVLSNGVEVELPTSAYEIVATGDLESVGHEINATQDANDELVATAGINTIEASFNVVINKTAETITHNVTITEAAAEMVSVDVIDASSLAEKELTSFDVDFVADTAISASGLIDALDLAADLTFEDQFANEYTLADLVTAGEVRLTISNVADADNEFTISANGAANASITGVEAGSSFTVTLKVDGVSKSFKVNVK